MKTNRQARRLFGAFGKISNTRRIHLRKRSEHWCGWAVVSVDSWKTSRRQRRAANSIPEEAQCGCGRWGEVNFEGNKYYCGGGPWCCP